MKTEKAIKARIEMGKGTDTKLLEYLKKNADKTIYDISKDLGWSTGKVQKSIKRLGEKLILTKDVGDVRIRKKYRVKEPLK